MDSLKKVIDAIDELPWIIKLILALPVLDFVWALYRITRSIIAKNTLLRSGYVDCRHYLRRTQGQDLDDRLSFLRYISSSFRKHPLRS